MSTKRSTEPSVPGATVSPFEDTDSLAGMRRDAFEGIGPRDGGGLLFGLGFAEGLFDSLRIAAVFTSDGAPPGPMLAAGLPWLFRPELTRGFGHLEGELICSSEARSHLREYPPAEQPICFVSSGYASGWYTALLGETILVSETACVACGDAACHFEARTLDAWQTARDDRFGRILPFLDFDEIRRRAEYRLRELLYEASAKEEACEGEMMGGFDAMSPAVHVWGPVMVLPYSGPDDCIEALEAVREDVGGSQIRVVIIDTTGSRIDALESVGLACLLDALDDQQLETVLVGVGERFIEHLGPQDVHLKRPLVVSSISEGITLGFQLSLDSR